MPACQLDESVDAVAYDAVGEDLAESLNVRGVQLVDIATQIEVLEASALSHIVVKEEQLRRPVMKVAYDVVQQQLFLQMS